MSYALHARLTVYCNFLILPLTAFTPVLRSHAVCRLLLRLPGIAGPLSRLYRTLVWAQ